MLHLPIERRLREAVAAILPDAAEAEILVRPCPDPRFGDYQCTSLMAMAKARRLNPRQLAADVLAKLDVRDWCETAELAGAGFINFRLKLPVLETALRDAAASGTLFFETAACPRTVVVDFSSPNVAKPMHVGHIRSTVLGDALARGLRLLGHRVVTDNHLGDWGTQFGMLLVGWKTDLRPDALRADAVSEMERLYRTVSAACREDGTTLEQARRELVRLQAGDPENLAIWREMTELSKHQFDSLYARLGVTFDHVLGESFYNPRLPGVVEDLLARGIARESEGAVAVFSDGSKPPREDPFLIQRDGEWQPNPQIVRKSDGGFNYAATDLATLDYRMETWRPDEIIYVTDGRQQLHFQQLFETFRRRHPGLKETVKLAHVWFGSILGADGRPFKTRSGENIRLADLLDEAEERAFRVVSEKNPELDEARRREIARIVGIGAVKYADLLPNRQSDYVFNWDKLLALNGNTAPYLQYAYARIRSIFRKSGGAFVPGGVALSEPDEIALARNLLTFGTILESVAVEHRPNHLCNYLYELAGLFARFYEKCPVLKAAEPERSSRLVLCELTARVLKTGLGALGVETLDQM